MYRFSGQHPHDRRAASKPRIRRSKAELQVQGLPQTDGLKKGFGEMKKIFKGLAKFSPSGAKDVRCCTTVGWWGGQNRCAALQRQRLTVGFIGRHMRMQLCGLAFSACNRDW